jgi:hypothetical protein
VRILLNDDNEFLTSLPKNLRGEYESKKETRINEIEQDFISRNGELVENKSRGIREDQFHKAVLNSCIFPFAERNLLRQHLDYVYLRSSPLLELNVKNVDFMIASFSKKIVIFGEAKGSVEDPTQVISQFKKRIEIIENNKQYIERFVPKDSKTEYVLGVPSMDAVETSKAILRSNVPIVLWEVGGLEEQQLSLVVPANTTATQRQLILHSDDKLNRALRKVPTSAEFKTFFHESHPVTKMELLTTLDKETDSFFTFNTIKLLVRNELDNTSESEVESITLDIIKLGIDVNFIRCTPDGKYKIKSIYKNSASRYDELKKKWIEYQIKKNMEYQQNEAIIKIQEEFLEKKKQFPSLLDFDKK